MVRSWVAPFNAVSISESPKALVVGPQYTKRQSTRVKERGINTEKNITTRMMVNIPLFRVLTLFICNNYHRKGDIMQPYFNYKKDTK
jgi:hypothetical protein